MKRAHAITWIASLAALLTLFSFANAQTFNGRYEGNLLLTTRSDDCGDKTQKFRAEVTGAIIRISSPLSNKAFEGEINANGQFFAQGSYAFRGRNVALEWRGQILSTKSGLGSLLMRSDPPCQFLISIKQN
jgi:hypothetical protein